MIHLDVWIVLADGSADLVGELVCGDVDQGGRFQSEFEYAASWRNARSSFSLDPASLPLSAGRFAADQLYPPLAVFEDALPDHWGRQIIIRARGLPREQQSEPYLLRELARHGLGLGALIFAEHGVQPVIRAEASAVSLPQLYRAAQQFESGKMSDHEGLQRLFVAGSSLGGGRPKAMVSDASGAWIAKFPSKGDGRFDVVGLEAAALHLAAAAGIPVPEQRIAPLGKNRRALLVRRFDVLPEGGRRHMLSLRTLCRERPGQYVQSYSELAETVRKFSSHPADDVRQLFQQMVFNAAIGNTDDHLKNFWMLHDAHGFRLSPAFDLLPDIGERREHVLAFEYERIAPTRSQLAGLAVRWGVGDGDTIIAAVVRSVRRFATAARQRDVPAANIVELGAQIERRLALLEVPDNAVTLAAKRATPRPR